ncbi:MAG: SCO family protein [Flavobacteriaceae bacterium]|nr:SCO family protein [Flavobacteriaceae bacterium]MDZ4149366.1 SCO family protein [Flavobacteriaceae bacterium]
MLSFFAKFKKLVVVLAILSVFILAAIYTLMKPVEKLPVYQPAFVNAELVDTTVQYVKKYHSIPDFSLTNQNGKIITQKEYQDKIYIADFFFTTCPSICPKMTANMSDLQHEIVKYGDVMLLSHTVTPEIDSVPVLKAYALKHHVNDEIWNLVTGSKKEIYELARKSYLAAKSDGDGGKYDMIHTENFVLIDKQKRIRGFYDGTNPEEMEKLLHDLKILRNDEP